MFLCLSKSLILVLSAHNPNCSCSCVCTSEKTLVKGCKALKGSLGEIHDPSLSERSPVVDTHCDLLTILQVGHGDTCPKWKSLVSGGQGVLVEDLSAGSEVTMSFAAIPGTYTSLSSDLRRTSQQGC